MTLETIKVFLFHQENAVYIPTAISVFGFSISFYGIFIVIAALFGIFTVRKEALQRKVSETHLIRALQITIIFSVIGARIYYVISEWELFIKNPLSIFNIRTGGLSFYGALIGTFIAVRVYCSRVKEDFDKMIDSLCIGAAAAAIPAFAGCGMCLEPVGKYTGHFFSVQVPVSEITGKVRDKASLLLQNQNRIDTGEAFTSMKPVAVYGFLLSTLIFLLLLFLRGKIKQKGNLFTVYLALNAVVMIFLESIQEKSGTIVKNGPVSLNIIVSVLILLTALIYTFFEWRKLTKGKGKKSR